ncbi:hypothetical protein A6A25_41315 [Saccharothrix sp. CB00851]|nr:hypothetical protein A6A25_41315 [Saccharothrix sp. CB00851]
MIKEVAWEVLKEISGWNDIVDCFTKGDIWGCAGLVAGLVPWGKAAKVLEAGYNALKAVGRLAGIVDKAKGVLRRVQTITDDITRAATEEFQKLVSGGSGSCAKHSFVATTLVLMADGSTKPISEVEIGDKVKATDPTTGETADRAVVATIVHTDEDDMTSLTVTNEGGTAGTVDATSWHPVWVEDQRSFVNIGDLDPGDRLTSVGGTSPEVVDVDRYSRVEPVYDLTIEDVHTYYVLASATSVLVHNCNKKQGIYEFEDQLNPGKIYVGKTNNLDRRLQSHVDSGRLKRIDDATCTHVCGTNDDLFVAEHLRMQELRGRGVELSNDYASPGKKILERRNAEKYEQLTLW